MASFSLAKLLYKWEVTIFNKKKRILLVEVEGPSEAPRFVSVYHLDNLWNILFLKLKIHSCIPLLETKN